MHQNHLNAICYTYSTTPQSIPFSVALMHCPFHLILTTHMLHNNGCDVFTHLMHILEWEGLYYF